jgi:glycosyltransferase involved in cell wall biosynthesis
MRKQSPTAPVTREQSPLPPAVLILHNRYRLPGGEDVVVAAQARLLRERGHAVRLLEKDNREIDGYGFLRKAALFFSTADNLSAAAEAAKIAEEFRPQIAHIHNTVPLLSPSVYKPLRQAGVKVVQWLHNYRLVCPAGTLHREGAPCRLCIDDGLKHAVRQRCWNHSKLASLALTRMLDRHRRAHTWHRDVDLFVALNTHMRDVLVEAGAIPADKVIVQGNFAEIAADSGANDAVGSGFVFAGRFTAEKGLATLLTAARATPGASFKIIGQGAPLASFGAIPPNVSSPGQMERSEALREIAAARALVFPSEWQEPFGLGIVEAMALGRPVIASRTAGPREIVADGETGLLFDVGDARQLSACVSRLQNDPELAARMGRAGRERYQRLYSPAAGYAALCEIHRRVQVVS